MSIPTAFHLSPTERLKYGELCTEAGRALNNVLDAIDEANKVNEVQLRAIHETSIIYNDRMAKLMGFSVSIAAPMRRVFNTMPPAWRNSPEGEAVASFIAEWEAFDPHPWVPKSPGDVEPPDEGDHNQFSTLPTEP